MRAIILAAGRGSRLKPHTDDRPKCMIDVGGKPILGWQMNTLKDAGINDVTIVTGYRAEQILYHARDYGMNVSFVHNERWGETNNGYSLSMALEGINEPVIVINGDTIFHPDVIRRLLKKNDRPVMACARKREVFDEDMKVIEFNGFIIDVSKEIDKDVCFGEFIGVSFFPDPTLLKRELVKISDNDWFEKAIKNMLNTAYVKMVDVSDLPYIEIDFDKDLCDAREYFRKDMPDWEYGIRHGRDVDCSAARDLIIDVKRVYDEYGITFWLGFGLLLGAIRDNRIIPWDSDHDFSVFWKDRDTVLKAEEQLRMMRIFIPEKNVTPWDRWYIRDGEKIEVNFYDDCGDRWQYEPSKGSYWYPKRFFNEFKTISFLGADFNVPKDAEGAIEWTYGADWRTPIKGKKQVIV